MSVINQMLKDLEQRETPGEESAKPVQPVVIQPKASPRGRARWVIVLLLLVIIAMAAGWWWTSVENAPTAHNAAETPSTVNTPSKSATSPESQTSDETVTPPPAPQTYGGEQAGRPAPPPRRTQAVVQSQASQPPTPPVQASQEPVNDMPEAGVHESVSPQPEVVATPSQTPATSGDAVASDAPAKAALAIAPVELSAEELAQLKFNQGMTENNRGKVLKARQLWQQALVLQDNFHEARVQLAASLYGSGDNLDALTVLHQGIQLTPRHGQYRLMAARIYYQQQQLDAGLKVLDADLQWLASEPELLELRASLAQQTGQHQTAIDSYLALLEKSPSNRRWLMGLAISYDQLQQKAAALAAYRRAISQQPMELGSQLGPASRQYVLQRIAALGG